MELQRQPIEIREFIGFAEKWTILEYVPSLEQIACCLLHLSPLTNFATFIPTPSPSTKNDVGRCQAF